MNHVPTRAALDAMLGAIAEAARAPIEDRPRLVAEAIGAHVADPLLLHGIATPCCAERYVRHLLHEDPEGGWAVAALVWRPGQMSPVHAHRSWCSVGVHRGVLAESYYTSGAKLPMPDGVHLRRPGDITHGPADPRLIHRLANLGCETAISIHAYGLPYERFCSDLNLVLAD
ncbi:MAG: cysteine dioxygenase family protein [Acetobacteraceae bacterium]|nr:cysteine dioxygenase family protein [Acetobacteraceae bacterium]